MQATTLFTIAILIIAAGLLATWLIKRKKGKSQVGTPPGQETTRSDAARSESPRTDSARVVPRETVESGNRGQVPAREPAATQPAAVKHGGKKGKSKKSGKKGATKAAPAAVENMAADAYVEEETVADTSSAEVLAENVLDDYSTQEAVAEQEWAEEPAYTATLTEELVIVDVQPELPPTVTVLVEETVIEEPVVEEPAAVEEPVIEEEPAVEETVFEEPVVEEPVVEEPVVEETVIEEPVTAETTTPAAVEFVDAPLEVDGFDDEIADIFMEEAEEVLETIHEYYPKWRDNFSDKKSLTEFRRGFHTLKGSGRMAKAFEVGELAWSIENMLNRVMDNSIQPGPEVCLVIDRTLEKVPFMLSAFHQRKVDPQPALTQRIYNAAVALAEGKPMPSID